MHTLAMILGLSIGLRYRAKYAYIGNDFGVVTKLEVKVRSNRRCIVPWVETI